MICVSVNKIVACPMGVKPLCSIFCELHKIYSSFTKTENNNVDRTVAMCLMRSEVTLRVTVSQSVSMSWRRAHLGHATRY
jgi:hypothetical protein